MGKAAAAVVGVVAAIGIAIAAPILAPVALGLLGITATTTAIAIATSVIGLALSLGVSMAMRALGVGAPVAKAAAGPPQIFRQSISESFIVYGKRRVGGLLVFYHARVLNGDHYRYFIIAVAGHECQGAVSFMLNDEAVTMSGTLVTSGPYANNAWLWFVTGTANQSALQPFVDECEGKWTTAHKGNGVAYIAARFRLTDDVVQAGMPNITAVIEGKKVRDSRPGTTSYSRNAALCFYDWMKMAREEGGFGAYPDEIPDDVWISAQANVCDETVGGGPRYACDAVITTGAPPNEIRDVFVVNMAGSYTFSGGKHLMRPGYWVPVSLTLSEDDLAGSIQVSPFTSADSAATEVQGTYVSAADNYQAKPFATQSVASTDVRQLNLDLAFTTSAYQAQRIAAIMLLRAQYEKTVVWPMNIVGLKAQTLDTVQVDKTDYGLNNYAWKVTGWGLSADFGAVIQLREENAEIYDDPAPVTPPTVPTISQPTPILTIGEIQNILRDTYPQFGGSPITASESGGSAWIPIPNFTLQYPSPYGGKAVTGTTITGLATSTAYYPYIDVDAPGDSTPSFGASTTYSGALNSDAHPYRIYLGQSVTTPASGSGGSSTGSGVGGGYGTGSGPVIP